TLAALGTAALVVGGNEAQAQDETGAGTSYDFTPIMAVEAVRDPAITARKIADQPVTVEKTDTVQDAIAEVVVSDQRLGWFDGVDAVRVQIDNDLFAGDNQDRDYTGGMSITISGER